MKDSKFDETLSEVKLSALQSLVTTFLGNHQSGEYEKEFEELLKSFHQLGALMSVNLHFLRSHFDYFPKNCGDLSGEQGKRPQQDIMGKRY